MDHTTLLPAEILCDIFSWTKLIDPIPNADQLRALKNDRRRQLADRVSANPSYISPLKLVSASERLAWISLSHVCSRWRFLAIDQTELWTDLPLVLGPRWFKSFITRSKFAPVSLDYSSFSRAAYLHWEQSLELEIVPTLRPRLRTYTTSFDGDNMKSRMLCMPWPVLEELEMTAMGRYTAHNLLDNHAPKLRSLSFSLYLSTSGSEVFPWDASFLSNLSVLDLLFAEGIKGTTMPQFLSALTRMPKLHHLRLRDNREKSVQPCLACQSDTTISLPQLKTLAFESAGAMISHISKHLLPPSSVRLILDSFDGDNWRLYCSRALNWLRADPSFTSSGFRSAHAILGPTMGRPGIVDLSLSRSFTIPPSEPSFLQKWHTSTINDADLRFKMRRDTTPNDPEDVVQVLQALQPSNSNDESSTLRALGLTLPLRFPSHELPESWLTPFYTRPLFANITTLCFNWPLLKCVTALTPGHELQHYGGVPQPINPLTIPFPSLEVLDFAECKLGFIIGWLPGTLEPMLRARREVGVPLRKVYLRMKEDVEDVREGRVDDVRWVLTLRSVEDVLGLVEELEGMEETSLLTYS
ncbi:hypothetical protein PENSPDRAFT_683881 [Peniophora sp. CONT]|nr:hypothetical protein PENSPDRAFT_683881 [Peniophora sp. CONT]